MDIHSSFTVEAPLDDVWRSVLNVHEVAPCVPGAEITETVDDTHFKGAITVKLGPAQVSYRGELVLERDEPGRAIILHARGTGLRGMGGATATITARLSGEGGGITRVDVDSQVDVSGRVAQFGRGIIQDVANRQLRQFASCLEQKLRARGAG